MRQPDLFRLFCQYAKLTSEFSVSVPVYADVPARRHRKRRIQKKWLKRFGTVRELVDIIRNPVHSLSDIPADCYHIEMRSELRARSQTIVTPDIPPLNTLSFDSAVDPVTPIKLETTVYEFPVVACLQNVTREMFEAMQTDANLRRALHDRIYREAEPIVREKTKINGVEWDLDNIIADPLDAEYLD